MREYNIMDNNDEKISPDRGGTLVIPVISASSSSFGGVSLR